MRHAASTENFLKVANPKKGRNTLYRINPRHADKLTEKLMKNRNGIRDAMYTPENIRSLLRTEEEEEEDRQQHTIEFGLNANNEVEFY